jgi:hypothetical protein
MQIRVELVYQLISSNKLEEENTRSFFWLVWKRGSCFYRKEKPLTKWTKKSKHFLPNRILWSLDYDFIQLIEKNKINITKFIRNFSVFIDIPSCEAHEQSIFNYPRVIINVKITKKSLFWFIYHQVKPRANYFLFIHD